MCVDKWQEARQEAVEFVQQSKVPRSDAEKATDVLMHTVCKLLRNHVGHEVVTPFIEELVAVKEAVRSNAWNHGYDAGYSVERFTGVSA